MSSRVFNFSSYIFRFMCCDACGSGEYPSLSPCSRCLSVAYCNVECQRAAWPTHKRVCRACGALTLAALQSRADKGDGAALADLGIVHFRGHCGVEASPGDAEAAWSRGTAVGHLSAKMYLAEFAPGTTSPRAWTAPRYQAIALESQRAWLSEAALAADAGDDEKAIALYDKCVASPSFPAAACALRGLGLIYAHGEHVPRDVKCAVRCWLAAADAAAAARATELSEIAEVEAEALAGVAFLEFADQETMNSVVAPKRVQAVRRAHPLIALAWSLEPGEVSPFLCAVLASGYATGSGVPCDIHEAETWMARAFTPPPAGPDDRSAVDSRQSDAMLTLRDALSCMHEIGAENFGRFRDLVVQHHLRVAAAWDGSKTDTSRTTTWWLAQQALGNAREGRAPFHVAHASLAIAAAEGMGCAAFILYLAYETGTDGVEPSPALAARWAACCKALGHGLEFSHEH